MAELIGVIVGPVVAAVLLLVLGRRVARPWKVVLHILAAACFTVPAAVLLLIVFMAMSGLGGHLG